MSFWPGRFQLDGSPLVDSANFLDGLFRPWNANELFWSIFFFRGRGGGHISLEKQVVVASFWGGSVLSCFGQITQGLLRYLYNRY